MGDEEVIPYSVKYLDGENEETTWISRAGKAEVTYSNGDTFVGDFNDLKQKHGQGTYTWNTRSEGEEDEDEGKPTVRYQGEYSNGCRSGIGKMTFPSGGVYYGQWSDNTMSGEGTFKYVNGDIYSGGWSNDQKHGEGKYLFLQSECSFVGTWEEDEITSGTWKQKDGTSFSGPFMQGFPCGEGMYRFNSGNKLTGEFIRVADKSNTQDEDATVPRWINMGVAQGSQ